MPYPDDTDAEGPPQLGEEELSETERHWNQLAVGIATIATAVIAAVLLITGLDSDSEDKWNDWDIAGAIFAGFAFFLYITIAVFITKVLFPPGNTRVLKLKNQRRQISNLVSAFGALVLAAGLVIFTAIIPPTIEWYQSEDTMEQGTQKPMKETKPFDCTEPRTKGSIDTTGAEEHCCCTVQRRDSPNCPRHDPPACSAQ